MKKKHISIIIIIIVAVLIVTFLSVLMLIKMNPKLYHQLRGNTVAEFSLDEYGKYLVIYEAGDELRTDAYHREDNGLWKKENMSGSTGDKGWSTTTYMETRNGETKFTHIWLYAQKSGISHEETIEVEGNTIDIKSYPAGDKYVNAGLCITEQNIGSTWLVEQVESVIRQQKQGRSAVVDWVYYTYKEAVERANTIVYGKVTDISDTFVLETEVSGGESQKDLYKEVTVEVKEVMKGDMKGSTVTFYEWGGETDDAYLIIEGYDPVNVNEEYIMFLSEYDRLLAGPSAILPVSEGIVSTKGKYAPELAETGQRPTEMSLEEYILAVKKVLE